MAELKRGDVVQLKSGGPNMTIDEIDDYTGNGKQEALCVWFEKNQRQTAVFGLHTLVAAE